MATKGATNRTRLTLSEFAEDPRLPYPQPDEIKAHESGIMITAWTKKAEYRPQRVFLSPRHIEAIVSMAEDWDDLWAPLHEEQA